MALQDILGTPDKVEESADVTVTPRGSYSKSGITYVYTQRGEISRTETQTTSTWTAATRKACTDFKAAYTGGGSIDIMQENKVTNSWQLILVETTVEVDWLPA